MGIWILYFSISSLANNKFWQYQPVNVLAVVSWSEWKDLDPPLAHVLLGSAVKYQSIHHLTLLCFVILGHCP